VSTSEHRDSRAADRAGVVHREGQLRTHAGAPPTGGASRFRLRASLELFFASDGDAYLLRAGGGDEYVLRQPTAAERGLLRGLADGGVDIGPASAEAAMIAPLVQAGLAVVEPQLEPLGTVDAQRFARQLPYLEDFGDPVEAQRRLRESSVAILGCGGLGTWTLGALACVGIGRFVLIDDDEVDLSNLNRQILYRTRDLGRPKVELARAWLAAFDPAIDVVAQRRRIGASSELREALSGCDALVLAADWPPYELNRWVNEACLTHGVPFISAGQQPPLLRIGPTHVPGRGACFACHEHHLRRDYPLYDELVDHRRQAASEAMTLGPASGTIGTLMAMEVMHLLLGHQPLATHDRALLLDMRTLAAHWAPVRIDPECKACRSLSAVEDSD
jgi:bacteriocin biosynthesis cyclodehydratase domain-containing protein